MQSQALPNVSAFVFLTLALFAFYHYSANLSLQELFPWISPACEEECINTYFSYAKMSQRDPDFIAALRHKYIYAPPRHPNTGPVDIRSPVWRELLEWDKMQEMLFELWKDKSPGTFVEIGAVDGEFRSQTLVLEKNLSWYGLLVEPDPRSFAILQERRRNASLSPLCISNSYSDLHLLWMMDLIKDLPQDYQALVMARSKLSSETVSGDEKQGRGVVVRCVPLSTLLMAAAFTEVDFLTIGTGVQGDDQLLNGVLKRTDLFDIKTILVQYTRPVLKDNPYPILHGYLYDMGRSFLMTRLYWRKTHCSLMKKHTKCHRPKHFDMVDACFEYVCLGSATVWAFE